MLALNCDIKDTYLIHHLINMASIFILIFNFFFCIFVFFGDLSPTNLSLTFLEFNTKHHTQTDPQEIHQQCDRWHLGE